MWVVGYIYILRKRTIKENDFKMTWGVCISVDFLQLFSFCLL